MHRDAIMHGHGHTTGSHASNYDSIDASTALTKAGYNGTDPQIMAAWVKALYQVRFCSLECISPIECLTLYTSSFAVCQ
eukprot:2100702-Prymnesium_polylepis.1